MDNSESAAIAALRVEIGHLRDEVHELRDDVQALKAQANRWKGGFLAIMTLGAIGGWLIGQWTAIKGFFD